MPASTRAQRHPQDKAPPPSREPRELPGTEYETATTAAPEATVDTPAAEEPSVPTDGRR
jgi:hypothetical protein